MSRGMHEVDANVFAGEIINRQALALAKQQRAFAVGDRLSAETHAHAPRTLFDVDPMIRICIGETFRPLGNHRALIRKRFKSFYIFSHDRS